MLHSSYSRNRQASIKDRIFNYLKAEPMSAQEDSPDRHSAFKHTCSTCGRVRSLRYQARHPLTSREIPCPGICSRCVRSAQPTSRGQLSKIETIYEVHHYHHVCSCQTTACTAADMSPVELPEVSSPRMQRFGSQGVSHSSKVYRPYTLPSVFQEQPPPAIHTHSKPTLSNSSAY